MEIDDFRGQIVIL
jgi:hypothetical protein